MPRGQIRIRAQIRASRTESPPTKVAAQCGPLADQSRRALAPARSFALFALPPGRPCVHGPRRKCGPRFRHPDAYHFAYHLGV